MSTADIIRPGCNTLLATNAQGCTVTGTRKREWGHPWFTTPQWLPKRKTWAAFVLAGFVNGRAPMVSVTAGELREARGTFYGQLVDANTGAAEIEQLARLAIGGANDSGLPDKARVDVPLYQNPPVGLYEWRAVGWDGAEKAPLFFQDRGVNNPPAGVVAQLQSTGTVSAASLTPPRGNRLLRACDVILHQPRAALSSSITIEPGVATGLSNVNQTLALREPAANDRLRLVTGTYSAAKDASLNFVAGNSLLASDYEEKTWDEIKIATVYLLSPVDTAAGSEPDATWQPFVAHGEFWNLSWAQPVFKSVVFDNIFRSLIGTVSILGGGAGLGAVNYIAASINDATQAALNLTTANSRAGSFWTPTGGGTTSTVPVTVPDPVKLTLDRAANNAALARAAKALRDARKLDPDFPYEGRKFNRALL